MLFFGLELPDTIVYKCTEAFVDFDFTLIYLFTMEHKLAYEAKALCY